MRYIFFITLIIHTIIAFFGVPYGWWVAEEARIDKKEQEKGNGSITESDHITANLRLRNTSGIYFAHVSYLVVALLTWALISLVYFRPYYTGWAFWTILVLNILRSIYVQSHLLWLSYKSSKDRLALRVLARLGR